MLRCSATSTSTCSAGQAPGTPPVSSRRPSRTRSRRRGSHTMQRRTRGAAMVNMVKLASTSSHVCITCTRAALSRCHHGPPASACQCCPKPPAPTAAELLFHLNFKGIVRRNLEVALERNTDWSLIHAIGDVNAAHKFLVDGIIAALDQVAPSSPSSGEGQTPTWRRTLLH
jgi:hypothetical protein